MLMSPVAFGLSCQEHSYLLQPGGVLPLAHRLPPQLAVPDQGLHMQVSSHRRRPLLKPYLGQAAGKDLAALTNMVTCLQVVECLLTLKRYHESEQQGAAPLATPYRWAWQRAGSGVLPKSTHRHVCRMCLQRLGSTNEFCVLPAQSWVGLLGLLPDQMLAISRLPSLGGCCSIFL